MKISVVGIDLKKAAKLFANKFSCGSSVTGDDEIVIQGDFSYDVIELIQSHWPEVLVKFLHLQLLYTLILCQSHLPENTVH